MDGDIDYTSRIPTRTIRTSKSDLRYRNNNYRYYGPSKSEQRYEQRSEQYDNYGYANPMTIFWIVGIILIVVVIIIALVVLFRPRPGSNWPQIQYTKGAIGSNCQSNSNCASGLVCYNNKCATNTAVQQELMKKSKLQSPQPQKIKLDTPLSSNIPVYKPIQKPIFDIPPTTELPIVVSPTQVSAVATAGFSG